MNDIVSPSQATIRLAEICRTLATSTDLDDIRGLRDQAEAIRHYVKTAGRGLQAQNQAGEVKLRCERRVGEILTALALNGGDRRSNGRRTVTRLDDLGISRMQSARWQREALVPEQEFVRFVQQANTDGRELTSSGLLRVARVYREAATPDNGNDPFSRLAAGLGELACRHQKFACIYADVVWPREGSRSEIAQLFKWLQRLPVKPVKPVAAANAHVHLWAPPELLEAGLSLLRGWGFRYKTSLVCGTAAGKYGAYWRPAHDTLLLGVRGRLHFRDSSLVSWLDGQDLASQFGKQFSSQPGREEVKSLISRVSPGPYLDLFGTAACGIWTTGRER
jgi:hypothetical protein